MTKAKIEERYTLLSNLDSVVVSGAFCSVRAHACALLVVRQPSPFDDEQPQYLLRGFHTQASLPTFSLEMPTDEFTLIDAHDPTFMVSVGNAIAGQQEGRPGKMRPLFSGAIMRWACAEPAPSISLITDVNSPHGIDVHRFAAGTAISDVWPAMERKIVQYWTAPFFPIVKTLPIGRVREALNISGVAG